MDNIVTLNNGIYDMNFEFLDIVKYNNEEYYIFSPVLEEGETETEVLILKAEKSYNKELEYVEVSDEYILEEVFEIFREKYEDSYTFSD